MDKWQERGLMIAESNTVEKNKLGWKVPSQSGNGTYEVNIDGEPFCTCQHFEHTHQKCQHIYAIEFIERKEKRPDGTEIITKSMRVWPIYDAAQMHEQEHFVELLRELCNGIEQPEYRFGRPRLPLSDVIFSIVSKVYSTMSGRRFMPELKEAEIRQLVAKSPSFASTFGYLEKPELTPLLKALIEQSASPLKTFETDFAVDSSGFSTKTYSRWFDHKYGKMRSEVKWIKTHVMCGVNTHIVTSVEATPTETADSPQLPELVRKTAKTFTIKEVSADKAYSSKSNLHAINAVNATPFVPFKSYSKGSQGHKPFDGLWQAMWHYYNFNREVFMQHYHKRSNAETVFSMIKAKFGSFVRAKTPIAQVNEVLCKILCHNICVLIQSIYELGLEPTFWQTLEPQKAVAPKMAWE
ncbi:MAG: transposase [Dehalococcoidia bacterium]|nr:transposase [Dehalococcoidia bacterium]